MNTVRICGESDGRIEVAGSISAEFSRNPIGETVILLSDGTAVELECDSDDIWRITEFAASAEAEIEVLSPSNSKMPNDHTEVAVVFLPEAPLWVGKASEDGIVERERAVPNYDTDLYQEAVAEFASKNDLYPSDISSQWEVVEEEFEEMQVAFGRFMRSRGQSSEERIREELAEEMADCIFTVHLAASMLGIDLRGEFREKAMYNLNKSGQRDANGKIIDDVSDCEASQ